MQQLISKFYQLIMIVRATWSVSHLFFSLRLCPQYFSKGRSPEELERVRDMAIVSSTIVNHIRNETADRDGVLGERLKLMKFQDLKGVVKREHFEETLKLFTSGVPLKEGYKDQARVTTTQLQSDAKQDQDQVGRYVFYPTWITTSHLFKFLHTFKKSPMMFTGDAGVGKTFSFILYCQLMRNIDKAFFTLDRASFNQLISKGTIYYQNRKVLYWNYSQKSVQNYKAFILDQCAEMYENAEQNPSKAKGGNQNAQDSTQYGSSVILTSLQNKKYNDLLQLKDQQFFSQIRKFYKFKHKMQIIVIVDQINALAAHFHKFASLCERKKNKIYEQNENLQELNEKIRIVSIAINQHNRRRRSIDGMADRVLYNSSVTIQHQFVKKTAQQHESMNLQGHALLHRATLGYQNRMEQPKAINQTAYYFAEIQSKKLNNSEKQKQELRTFYEENLPFALPLMVSNENLSIQKFKTVITSYYTDKINQFSTFIKKRSQSSPIGRHQMMIVLSNIEWAIKEMNQKIADQQAKRTWQSTEGQQPEKQGAQKNSQSEKIVVKSDQIMKDMHQIHPLMNYEQLSELMNPGVFPLSKVGNQEAYICTIPASYIVDSFRNLTAEIMLSNTRSEMKAYSIHPKHRLLFGISFELLIIKACKAANMENKQRPVFYYNKMSHFIFASAPFKHFNGNSYSNNMDTIFEKAKQIKNEWVFGWPVVNFEKKEHSTISFAVDFCLVRYYNKKYEIKFFDLKTGETNTLKSVTDNAKQFKRRVQQGLRGIPHQFDKVVVLCMPKIADASPLCDDLETSSLAEFAIETNQKNIQIKIQEMKEQLLRVR